MGAGRTFTIRAGWTVVAALALATIVGLVALWPGGELVVEGAHQH
jgi:hypothetical protein